MKNAQRLENEPDLLRLGADEPAAQRNRYFCFNVKTTSDPQCLLKILGLFAQRNIVPLTISAQSYVDTQEVRIVADGLSKHETQIIAAKMEAMVLVNQVAVTD